MSSAVTPHTKAAKRHSYFSSQSTFEVNSLFGRSPATPKINTEAIQWVRTLSVDPGGRCSSAKGWCGTEYVYLPEAGRAGVSYQLPVADQRGVNPTLKSCSPHRYPIITSAHFQLYQAGFRPDETTLGVVAEAEAVAEPYVASIKRLAQIKARAQLTVVVVLIVCLLYMCVGAAHRTELVWTYLVLSGGLLAALCLVVILLNKRLRIAYEGLTAALEAFAHSKADLALRGYAVTALGPFVLHITILSRFTMSFSSPEYRQIDS